ncbi:MAG: PQQ-binding-like beta-propeller repeat protein [Gemmataceae bacterium]
MKTGFLTVLLTLAGSSTCLADWPQFRGPTQQGHSDAKGLPVEWSSDQNVAWKVEIPGKGWSSPIASGGKIYVTTAVAEGSGEKKDQSLRALCLDSKTGKIVWNREVFHKSGADVPGSHSKNSQASPTPVFDKGNLYVHFGHFGTACLKAADGSVVWKNEELKYAPVHGNGGSPMLHDGKLIFMIDGTDRQEVVALNATTGKIAWRTPRAASPKRPFSFCTPLIVELDGKLQLISQGSDVVMSLDPKTGNEIWRYAYSGYSIVPRPVAGKGMIYVSTGYDNAKLLALKPKGSGTLTASALAWKSEKNAPHNPSMILDNGLLYAVSDVGNASCWDAATGKVIWSERIPENFTSSILLAEGRLYLHSESGTTTVLKAGRTFETLATNKLDERTLSSFAVDGKALLIRTEKNLYRIETK